MQPSPQTNATYTIHVVVVDVLGLAPWPTVISIIVSASEPVFHLTKTALIRLDYIVTGVIVPQTGQGGKCHLPVMQDEVARGRH